VTVLRSIGELRRARGVVAVDRRVGFVPTMGALHAGHGALFTAARGECDAVAASIFVNPAQFNDPRDFAAYPRTEAADEALARTAGVDWLFVPPAEAIYPRGHATAITLGGAARGFEGDHRPGHFDGVALVCVKLFHLVEPDVVYFGQKDAQQVAVVRQVVRDLDLPIELAGLAAWRDGRDAAAAARAALTSLEIDYVAVADFEGEPTLVLAVRAGETRLIDNVPLNQPELAGL
jgi:pantoate--beta-alanine ligase